MTDQGRSRWPITADGATLAVVNPDPNSVTLVDTATQTPRAELTVGG